LIINIIFIYLGIRRIWFFS